ncbi:MAG: histidine kinase dimerization/phospho-acceptor domain-containing protein [Candidatus Gastranaerophilaceae bacterium]
MKRRLFGQFFPSYLLIILILLTMSVFFTSKVLKQFYFNQVEADLKARAFLIEEQINKNFSSSNAGYLNRLCKKLDQKTSMRVTIILPSGKVIADSEENPSLMDNHKDRPEIMLALADKIGNSIRYSHTLKKDMMYVAIPVVQNQKTSGIIRVSVPLLFIDKVLKVIYFKIVAEGLIAAIIAAAISFFIAGRISKPLEDLGRGAEHFAKGDLQYRLSIPKTKEIGELALAMNEMAAQLDNKIIQLKKLENIRRDFIANVSHELRTPITSIKGYAETLIDGALDNKEKAEKFINTILSQANRLNSIIEDLLSLSRLEQESKESELNIEKATIIDIINSATQLCSIKADTANIKLEFSCPNDIKSIVNSSLIEQAIVNLVDNAIKYSTQGSKVLIEALLDNNEIVIKVIDQGCGIPEEHLSRIFERFYRVDKARSRKLG